MKKQNAICINIQMEQPYMTREEFAKKLDVSTRTIDRLRQQGVLKCIKMKDDNGKDTEKGTVLIDLVAVAVRNAKNAFQI
ncbi:TPA: helix-turn-helix domain-containing protein [Haemophilus influenzae]|uniref:Helix-turn-helix domain-containing protein n=1 Tax=Haemophilus influenzae TaxID=727 RepID=A0A2S9RPZ9_HAEIF|nr:helix-turn-helix domain-containing protein [Haemophilus influenzae]AXP61331.1 DNA-binding protein [Haemophilus influenzae]MCK8886600.1 helix-turn-helix domain-containing protein [Haemophilus influenzae]MCK8917673.1 helix-turn-helix domain-containing protein [Haemophilus influenzae]MCK8936095.1 helix-turn-helix domain-containing protein [Haemophilus influenzae]MCK8939395.1 helix-turn-helix domain-containing protein [Haemophilus influenzae]